jgi:hypothetical protein
MMNERATLRRDPSKKCGPYSAQKSSQVGIGTSGYLGGPIIDAVTSDVASHE